MSQTVLVADDSQTIRKIVEMALKASGWSVVGVGSAQEALSAAQHAPSVILLDYYMPDGSGYDVCRSLKQDAATSGIPVVMLGGTYKQFDENLARQAGADQILMKPFKTDALINALESAAANGASVAPPPPAPPAPEPAYQPPEPAHRPPEPTPEPIYSPPEPAYQPPEPAYEAPEPEPVQEITEASEPEIAAPEDNTPLPQAASQPRIPTDPPQPSAGSAPDIAARPDPAPAPAGGLTVDRGELEAMVREEVKSAVREELPGLLRNVMGEIFQQKVLPKLMEHAETRVQHVVQEQLTGRIQELVRVELERLLNED